MPSFIILESCTCQLVGISTFFFVVVRPLFQYFLEGSIGND